MTRIATLLTSTLLAAGLSSTAAGQMGGEPGGPPVDIPMNFISFGVATTSDYAGSDDYRLLPFGAFRYEWGDVVIQSEGPGLSATIWSNDAISAGPFVRYYGGRDDDIEDAIVKLLPEVDGSAVIGGFVRAELARGLLSPVDRLSVSARAGLDAAGTIDGLVWSTGLEYGAALSRTQFAAISLSASGFSDDYADQHFSIDAAGALASGLSAFEAEGGVRDIGLTVIFDQALAQNWSVTLAGGYSRLMGDYADSPIVSVRGSEDQFFAGIGLGRRF
ncbi:MAG: MipA/OmpV family protein [Pseudomonadota bacterium]